MLDYAMYAQSDAGSVAVGTKGCWFLVPNGHGDGETVIEVYAKPDDFDQEGWRFQTVVEGRRIEILDYDCPSKEPWFDGSVHDWNPMDTLDGRFAIYNRPGMPKIALVRWGDAREL